MSVNTVKAHPAHGTLGHGPRQFVYQNVAAGAAAAAAQPAFGCGSSPWYLVPLFSYVFLSYWFGPLF